jgi:uncharacterized membrane protein
MNGCVTVPASELRARARVSLSGRWGSAILAAVIYYLLLTLPLTILEQVTGAAPLDYQTMWELFRSHNWSDAISTSSLVGDFYLLLVTGPLTLGLAQFILTMARNGAEEPKPWDVINGFSSFGRAFGTYLLIVIFTFLWSLLFIIPGIIAAYRYRMAYYILLDEPEIGPLEAISRSKQLMVGNKWKLFCLDFSYILWLLLGSLFYGLLMIFVLPYYQNGVAQFYLEALDQRRSLERARLRPDYQVIDEGVVGVRRDEEDEDDD